MTIGPFSFSRRGGSHPHGSVDTDHTLAATPPTHGFSQLRPWSIAELAACGEGRPFCSAFRLDRGIDLVQQAFMSNKIDLPRDRTPDP